MNQAIEFGAPLRGPVHPRLRPVDGPLRVRIADLDQDGFGDVLTSNHATEPLEDSMSVVINAMEAISP